MISDTQTFLASKTFAVAGASEDRNKYGNKVLRCYLQHSLNVVGIHPRLQQVEETPTFKSLVDVPHQIEAVSIVTPPAVTEQIVRDAISHGVKHLWMQPGAESSAAIEMATEAGMNVIAEGPCLLVVLGYRE